MLNQLAPTANGANTVAVNTGGALVDGKPYYNSASVDVNIPSASGGGNTRIDRVVLRAGWAAQTVRITRIAGTDAASPTAPAMTQTPGTTYDISLCTVLVDTAGAVTVTDARTWAAGNLNSLGSGAVTSIKLLAGAVTSSKLGADSVNSTAAGNRVVVLERRQGGGATAWSTSGTTTYTPTTVRMQLGVGVAQGSAMTVTFPTAFSAAPFVLFRTANELWHGSYTQITPTNFTIDHVNIATPVYWLAVGPE